MPLFLALLGAFLLYQIQKALYSRYWSKGLTVDINFDRNEVTEGESCALTEVVTNQKALPLPGVHIKFQISRNLRFTKMENTSESDKYYRSDIFALMPWQRITRTLDIAAEKRGYYQLGQLNITSTDLFLEGLMAESQDSVTELYVFPAMADPQKIAVPYKQMTGAYLTNRFFYEDPFEFKGIRPYQSYDTMNKINWKASARTGEWKVNQYHDTVKQEINILLNLESESVWKYYGLLEESIRLALSFLVLFSKQGIPTTLTTNGRDIVTGRPIQVGQGAGPAHITHCSRQLARIDLEQTPGDFTDVLASWKSDNNLAVLISSSQKPELQKAVWKSLGGHDRFSWVVVLHPDMPHQVEGAGAQVCFVEVPYEKR